jgi:hypothetical protein
MATDIIQLSRTLRTNLQSIGEELKKELTRELIQQGHKATGRLIDSIEYKVSAFVDGLQLEVSYLSYGAIVNNGVAANRVPYGRRNTGAKTSQYIQALTRWVQQRNIAQGIEARGVAFAIAKTHAKTGIPTPKSVRFSLNGRRIGFQDYVISTKQQEIDNTLQGGLEEAVSAQLDLLVSSITQAA